VNLKFLLSYDGTDFFGWQKTPTGPTIEESLERALSQILQEPIFLQAASRTDRGVHALGQVVNCIVQRDDLDLKLLQKGLNAILPKTIRVLQIEKALDSFHPTLDAKAKEYHYYLCTDSTQLPFHRRFSWHIHYPLDLASMQEATQLFLGTHDFSAVCNERSLLIGSATRTLSQFELHSLPGKRLRFILIGNHFLYKMVRNLVGTLVDLGKGKFSFTSLSKALIDKDRRLAGVTAPAHGLFLKKIFYNEINETYEASRKYFRTFASSAGTSTTLG
jgi:tRNA pseudouridine38-40 synthase